jgi:hypothetical protein
MHVVPAQLQGQPHQVRPMWTARQILGNFIRRRLTTPAADERATANSILSSSFSAYRRDQWRISSNYSAVKLLIGTGEAGCIECARPNLALLLRAVRRECANRPREGHSGEDHLAWSNWCERLSILRSGTVFPRRLVS